MHWVAPSEKDIENGSLEKRLWAAADQFRANSGLKSQEYSAPVLGLIFLRFAEVRFAAQRARLEKTAASSRRGSRVDEPAAYHAEGILYLVPNARFDFLLGLPEAANIGAKVNGAMRDIEKHNPQLAGVLPKTYNLFTSTLLKELLKKVSEIPATVDYDAFGRIYEYFLGEFARTEGQKGGEFYTPACIVRFLTEIIEPYHGRIFDPACGSGGMFVSSARFVAEHKKNPAAELSIHGIEKTDETGRLCRMNLAVHGLEGEIRHGGNVNSYYDDPHDAIGKFDFVLANPPFNVNAVDKERLKDSVGPGRRLPFGLPRTDNANYLWIQLFYSALNAKGRAGFVMANSASDARSSEQELRQKLVEAEAVDVMVAVGPNMFYTVTLPCTLWFFDKGKQKSARTGSVLFIDARHIYRQIDRAHRDWTSAQIGFIANVVRLYPAGYRAIYVEDQGVATSSASVTVNGAAAYRKGDYYRGELAVSNGSGPVYLAVTNQGTLTTNNVSVNGHALVAQTPENFGYDADGNLTNDGEWNYTWDGENRLIGMQSLSSIPDAAKRQMTYAYDDQGRRIYARTMEWNTNNDSYTLIAEERYWYDGWNLIGRGDSATELAQKFVWGLDLSGAMQGAGGVGGLLMLDDSQGKSYFYGFDGNGNVLMLANANDGTTAAQYDYGPFGEVIRSTGPMAKANPFRFSTKYQDDESDLLYYGSRYYNASAGKWLSRDLIEEKGGYNVYSFVLNNPQEYYDKIGFAPQEGAPSLAIVQPIWTDDECGAFQLEINWSIFPPSKDGGYIVQSVQMRALEYNCEEPEKLVHSDKFRYDEAWKVYKAQSANNLQQPNQIELTGLDYFQHRPSTSHSRGLVIFKATARFEEGMTLLGMGSIWKRYNPNTVAQSLFSTTQVPGPMWPADPLNPFANQAISKPVSRRLVYAWDCCCKKTRPYVESSDVNVAREIEIVENLMQENDPDTPEGVQRQEEDNWERSLVE